MAEILAAANKAYKEWDESLEIETDYMSFLAGFQAALGYASSLLPVGDE